MFVSSPEIMFNPGQSLPHQGVLLIIAQEGAAVDQTGRRFTMIIIALLVIAFLLSGLTAWYWQRTDPRRKVALRRAQPQGAIHKRSKADGHAVAGPHIDPQSKMPRNQEPGYSEEPVEAWNEEVGSEGGLSVGSEGGLSAEEWLRLTGPVKSKSNTGGESRG